MDHGETPGPLREIGQWIPAALGKPVDVHFEFEIGRFRGLEQQIVGALAANLLEFDIMVVVADLDLELLRVLRGRVDRVGPALDPIEGHAIGIRCRGDHQPFVFDLSGIRERLGPGPANLVHPDVCGRRGQSVGVKKLLDRTRRSIEVAREFDLLVSDIRHLSQRLLYADRHLVAHRVELEPDLVQVCPRSACPPAGGRRRHWRRPRFRQTLDDPFALQARGSLNIAECRCGRHLGTIP